MRKLLILTGASGSGKTAAVDYLRNGIPRSDRFHLLNFDSIGVPSEAVMIREFGSSQNWQKTLP